MDGDRFNPPTPMGADPKYVEMLRMWHMFRKRYQAAWNVADLWRAVLEACYFYAIPQKNRFYRPKEQQGEVKASRVYDTTAVEATKNFVSKLHDAMTPPQVQWGFLELDETFDTEEDIDRNQIQEELDDYMRKMFIFIHQSNFDVIINESYFDLAVGTGVLVINSYNDEEPLLFTSIPMDKLAIEEAFNGRVESWYRYWELIKVNEIKLRWPNAILSQDMLMMLEGDEDAVVRLVKEGVMYKPELGKKPYVYMVGTMEHPILCEFYESNPGIVWRFQKVNSEVFGRGPIMDALPSIISLNELARIEIAAANLNTFRPYMGFSDAVFNPHTFKLEPFTVIPIAPIGVGGSPPLIPLPDSSNPQFSQLSMLDLRNQIKALMFNDVTNTQSVQPQTATELMIIQNKLAQQIGPLFSRLQQEFLWPVIKRISYILDKRGLLPKPSHKGIKYNFKYKSPLALAKGQQAISRFTNYMQLLQGMYGPEMSQVYINPAITPYLLAEMMQVDKRFLNDPKQVLKVMQDMQNQQDQLKQDAQNQGQPQPSPEELTQAVGG